MSGLTAEFSGRMKTAIQAETCGGTYTPPSDANPIRMNGTCKWRICVTMITCMRACECACKCACVRACMHACTHTEKYRAICIKAFAWLGECRHIIQQAPRHRANTEQHSYSSSLVNIQQLRRHSCQPNDPLDRRMSNSE